MRRIDKTLILLLLGCGVAGGTAAAPAGGLVRTANGTPAAGMAAVAEEALNDDTETTPRNVPIDSVVVTGTRYASDIRHLPMSVSVIGRPEIDQRHETSLLPLLTEQVPGLFVTSRGVMGYGVSTGAAGGMSLRGLGGGATSQMLVLIDGQPQYMGIFGHPIADACQSLLAERVEVVRGPASVLYGSNAMGGVVNIVTRQQREEGIRTDVDLSYGSWNTLRTEAANRIRKGRFSSVVSASYNRTDGHRADMGFEQYGGFAKVGYAIADHWQAAADVNLTHFNASNPGPVTARLYDNDSRITRGMASLGVENHYERSSGALKFYYNWGRHRINDGYKAGEEPLDYRFNSRDRLLGLSLYQSAELWHGGRVTAGFDWQHIVGEAWNRSTVDGSESSIVDRREDEVAGYAEFRQLVGRFSLDAGLRVDWHSRTGVEWVPQFGVSMQALPDGVVKASVSKGFRNPTIKDLYMFGMKNPDLSPERVWNYEVAWSHRPGQGRLAYGVNLFWIEGRDIIQTVTIDGRPKLLNQARVENRGVEGEISWRIAEAWRADANYSYLWMKYPVLASPRHKLYAGASYAKSRWTVAAGVQYVDGLYTEVTPGAEIQENFVLLNLRASFRVNRRLTIYAHGENLLAREYEINAGYPMPRATVFGGIKLNL